MRENYYEQIDERVFEAELNNGLKLFIIPKKGSKNICDVYYKVRLVR